MSTPDLDQQRAAPFSPLARAVIESVNEAVFVFNADGAVTYTNGKAAGLLRELGVESGKSAESIMPLLARKGGRIAPLRVGSLPAGEAVFVPVENGPRSLADRERLAIVDTLDKTDWKLAESAKLLGISRTTLWRRLKAYGLHRERGGWPNNGE